MPTRDELQARADETLPGLIGIEFVNVEPGHVEAHLTIRPQLLAPNGFLHAASVIALADTACGFGAIASLPPGAHSFTTLELKSNFLGTAREGMLICHARLAHGGRTTQVWDAEVTAQATGRTVALFRCTQLLLYERGA